jgi:tight adherence protein B
MSTGAPGLLVAGAVALGAGLALLTSVLLLGRRAVPAADRRLAAYFGERGPSDVRASAVALVGVVVPVDLETRLARLLAGAGLTIRPAEWVLLQAAFDVAVAGVGLLTGGPVLMIVLLVAAVPAPLLFLRLRHSRRLAAFAAQLPPTLGVIANSLSAGLSVPQSIDSVVREGEEPMAGELRRALVEQRLGVELDDALDAVAIRMGSTDFGWVVMAMRIQREVGGNLAEILMTVADTLREREFVRRQVRSLSAEGRLSAWILGVLPVAMLVYLLIANRAFVRPLYASPAGQLLLVVAGLLLGAGAWVMSRLVRVEV